MHSLPSALALVTTLAASASAHAQVNVATVLPRDRETELAISAAPPDVGSKATVYVFTSQGYQKARDGENGFTCLVNRDSELEGYHVLAGDVADFDAATGKILKRAFPSHIMIYAPGVTPQDIGLAGRAAFADVRAPLMYESATGYRYLVVRVP